MANSKNKVNLMGNLTRDPKTSTLPSGKAVCNFDIATTESWKNKQTGQWEEETEYHHIVTFDKHAERIGSTLKKGYKIDIEGRLRTRKWQDKDTGKTVYITEIVVVSWVPLGPPKSATESTSSSLNQQQNAQQSSSQRAPQNLAGQLAQ